MEPGRAMLTNFVALVRPERPLIAAHSLDQDGLEAHQRCQRGSAEVFLSIAIVCLPTSSS